MGEAGALVEAQLVAHLLGVGVGVGLGLGLGFGLGLGLGAGLGLGLGLGVGSSQLVAHLDAHVAQQRVLHHERR